MRIGGLSGQLVEKRLDQAIPGHVNGGGLPIKS